VAAGPAIARLWRRGGDHPAEDLFRAAGDGDPEAARTARIVAAHLARAVELVAFAYDPDLVVLGGGVGSVGDPLLSAIRSCLIESGERSALVRRLAPPERLVSIPKGLAIGAIGAAAMARTRFGGDGGVVHPTVAGRMP
jgi:predicted NBD/HSP70 family sugar kinase